MTISNSIIINGKPVQLPDEIINLGCKATNYLQDGEPHVRHFDGSKIKKDLLVLHETGGNTAGGCEATLLKKGLGIHFILGPDGWLSNHADCITEFVYHAGAVNKRSIGIEVVNPYSPVYDAQPYEKTIPAEWWTWVPSEKSVELVLKKKGWTSVPKAYCVPTDIQMRIMRVLPRWLCSVVGIPYVFPTQGFGPKKIGRSGVMKVDPKKLGAGVACHRDFANHADGRYLLEALF